MIAPDCKVQQLFAWIRSRPFNAYLGEPNIFIRILNHRRHAIAVQREESRLLQLGSGVDLGRVGHVELVEKEGYFPGIGSGWYRSTKPKVRETQ